VDPLDRLFQELVRAAEQAGALHRPIAIREIVEDLLPYRVVRPTRIAELLDEYRQLVMRLVSGERNLVEADPEVRAACSAALASRHPDLSLLETYGDRLLTVVMAPMVERPSVPPLLEPDATSPLVDAPSALSMVEPASGPRSGEPACLYCARPLPGGRDARYCPWCGQHLLARCRMCRSSLEASWIFCITCGHPT